MVATQQRLTKQRFVRGLRRGVQRARYRADYRRVASIVDWVLRDHRDSYPQWTWRDVSRDNVHLMSEEYGDVRQFPNHAIRDSMIATRIRLTM